MKPIDALRLLTTSEHDFLVALSNGETAAGYARRSNYSVPWSVWMSKKIREKLGVKTIVEAVEMSDFAGLEGRIGGLEKKLDDAIEKLGAAITPKQTSDAAGAVRDVQAELAAELRSRGLTMKDLDAASEAKFQSRVDERVAAALRLRDEEAAAAAATGNGDEGDKGDEGDGDGKTTGEKIRDGLGGIRNLR